jgi:hypothetical protein
MEELLAELFGGLFGELAERLGSRSRESPPPGNTLKVSCEQCGWCFWAPETSLGQRCGHCRQGRLYRAYWFDQVTSPPPDPLFLPIGTPSLSLTSPVLASPSPNRLPAQHTLSQRRRRPHRRNQAPLSSTVDPMEADPASLEAPTQTADYPFPDQG